MPHAFVCSMSKQHAREHPRAKKAKGGSGGRPKEAGDKDKEMDVYEYSFRVSAHRPMAEYSMWNCLCYSFYAPLYLAGPTLTFNAFVSHVSALPLPFANSAPPAAVPSLASDPLGIDRVDGIHRQGKQAVAYCRISGGLGLGM